MNELKHDCNDRCFPVLLPAVAICDSTPCLHETRLLYEREELAARVIVKVIHAEKVGVGGGAARVTKWEQANVFYQMGTTVSRVTGADSVNKREAQDRTHER